MVDDNDAHCQYLPADQECVGLREALDALADERAALAAAKAELEHEAQIAHQLRVERDAAREALAYYADPESYFAVTIMRDPPCGWFGSDWGDTGDVMGYRPGTLARFVLADGFASLDRFFRGLGRAE